MMEQCEKDKQETKPQDILDWKAAGQYMIAAALTGVMVAGIFAGVLILFVLFCALIWF